MSYLSNLPQEIQEKIDCLARCQKQIASLEAQLQGARKDCERLQEELQEYHSHVTIEQREPEEWINATGIDELPDEVLLQVFESFLKDNHKLIRRLLLVCKRWHSTVMQSNFLWARIQLSPGDYVDYQDSPEFLTRYIEACLQRSQSLLLDVDIDYIHLKTREEYIRERVQDTVSSIVDDDDDAVFDWADRLDCDFPCAEYDQYFEGSMGDLNSLLGPSSVHMERWKTLTLSVPWRASDLAYEIWCKLSGSTPNLQSLSLAPVDMILNSTDFEDLDDLPPVFPWLPALRSLTLDRVAVHEFLPLLPIHFSTLLHLDINYESLDDLTILPSFTALRTLTLHTSLMPVSDSDEEDTPGEIKDPSLIVRLPNLRNLSIFGCLVYLTMVRLDLPDLHQLFIQSYRGVQVPANISPQRFHWSIMNPGHRYWTPGTLKSGLKKIIRSYTQVEELTIQEIAKPYVAKVLAELQEASSLPQPLRTIVIDLANGDRECLDIPTAL